MKKAIHIFLFTLLTQWCIAQTTYTANNNPGAVTGVNIFTGATAAQDAIAATVNGDVVYIVPSGTNYGDLGSISTEITIYGIGLDPNQTAAVRSYVSKVRINASNVRLSGLTFLAGDAIDFIASFGNIMIDNCSYGQLLSGFNISNLVLQNNIMGLFNLTLNLTAGSSGVRISNNIIYGPQGGHFHAHGYLHNLTGAIIENNVFIGNITSSNQRAFREVHNCSIKNNIFYAVRAETSQPGTFTNNTFEYNLSFGANNNFFPSTNGNTSSNNLVNIDPMFVNVPYSTSYSFSYDPTLQAGSPALTGSESGAEVGIFGGGTPLDLTFTSLPTIQSVVVPSSISQGSDLPINIKGNGN